MPRRTRTSCLLLLFTSLLFHAPRSCSSWSWQVKGIAKSTTISPSKRPSSSPSPGLFSPTSDTSSSRLILPLARSITRRSVLLHSPQHVAAITSLSTIFLISTPTTISNANAAAVNAVTTSSSNSLQFTTTPSGLQYADVKLGSSSSSSSSSPINGQIVSIDYVMSTTGARYGSKIYSTVEAGQPYRWKLGDGSTIPGLEEAVRSMTPGGIRRVIIPAKLAYQSRGASAISIRDECDNGKGIGPIPPASEAMGEFQRFKNIYCNPDRVYQPDLVLDVKLYGKR